PGDLPLAINGAKLFSLVASPMSHPRSTTATRINFPPPGGRRWVTLAALFFCSGTLALIYEVLWQRQFALVFGSAAPATAAVLAAYFGGFGAGSLALGAAAKRWTRLLQTYAVLEALIGAGALLVTPLLSGYERLYPWLFEHFSDRP